MPYRITLSPNSNQSKRTLLLLPTLTTHASLLTRARQKLRQKSTRLFLPGGAELLTDADVATWLSNPPPTAKGYILLSSSGEGYVGAVDAPFSPLDGEGEGENGEARIELLGSDDGVRFEREVLEQVKTAAGYTGMEQVTALPDVHPGMVHPIGAVFVSRGYVHPALIGGDIGCGMAWYRLLLKAGRVDGVEGRRRVAGMLCGLEGDWGDAERRGRWLGGAATGRGWLDRLVGTIGRGNHFAEVQVVEEVRDGEGGEWVNPVREKEVLLLVHSGSRGFGKYVLEKYTTGKSVKDAALHVDSDEAKEYLKDHDMACEWASRNRDLIAIRFLELLEPGEEWSIDPERDLDSEIFRLKEQLNTRKILSIHHNNLTAVSWPPNDPETTETVFLHRKGAAPVPGNELLPLPSSRGTPTLLLHPLPPSMPGTGGRINALSMPHGTGRTMSRGAATKLASDKTVEDALTGFSTVKGTREETSVVICDQKNLVWEEAPQCYKDVNKVAEEMVKRGLVQVVGRANPVVCYKVRDETTRRRK